MSETPGTRKGAPFPRIQLRDYPAYRPINTITETASTALLSTFLGFSMAAIKGAMIPSSSILGGVRANSRLIWLAPCVTTPFVFIKSISTNLREKNSPLNSFLGGAASGMVLGATTKQLPKVCGFAFFIGLGFAAVDFFGYPEGLGRDWFEREPLPRMPEEGEKQQRYQTLYRRPLSQTIEELGDFVRPFK